MPTSDFSPLEHTKPSPVKPHKANSITRFTESAYRRYGASLHRYLLRRLPRAHDADDLSQEVFLRLLRVDAAELVQQPQRYLYGIAANVVREYLMRRYSERERMVFDSNLADYESEKSGQADLSELPEQIDATRWLQQALSRLSPMHRAVVLCLKRDGMSYEETARATGLTYWTVEKYYFQAKAQLKAIPLE
jgi:RNA polymerase sigma factor (sigma-70 family)